MNSQVKVSSWLPLFFVSLLIGGLPVVIGVGITKCEQSDGPVAPSPSAYLDNARKNLRLALLDSHSFQKNLCSSNHGNYDSLSVVAPRGNNFAAQGHRGIKWPQFTLEPIEEGPQVPSISSVVPNVGMEDTFYIAENLGHRIVEEIHVSCRFSDNSFWVVTVPSGDRFSMEWLLSEDARSKQVAENELNALHRIRGISGLAWYEFLEDRRDDQYVFTVCLIVVISIQVLV